MDGGTISESCIGIHLNLVIAFPPNTENPMEGVTDKELKLLENFNKYKTQVMVTMKSIKQNLKP